MAQSELSEQWRERLQGQSGIDLAAGLSRFPELANAVALPALAALPQEGSFVQFDGDSLSAEIHIVWTTAGGERAGTLSLDFDASERSILLQDMHLATPIQGQGAGRVIVRQVASLGSALGMRCIQTQA